MASEQYYSVRLYQPPYIVSNSIATAVRSQSQAHLKARLQSQEKNHRIKRKKTVLAKISSKAVRPVSPGEVWLVWSSR